MPDDGPPGAIDRMLDSLEGTELPHAEKRGVRVRCDKCSGAIKPNRRVQMYASSTELSDREHDGAVGILRVYCPDCSVGIVKYPHRGSLELILSAKLTTDYELTDVELESYSLPSDGNTWDPVEVWESVTTMPFHAYISMTGGMQVGPEDIVDTLLVMGIDIREVLDDDGNVDIDDQKRAELDERIAEFAEDYMSGDAFEGRTNIDEFL